MATTKKKAVKKNVVKKKAVKKKAVKKAAAKKTAVKKPAAKKAAVSNAKIKVTHEQHHKMICEAAYYISLDRTSETVNPTEDWLQAEAAINKICIIAD
jgi:outer membrane biosynthesis protein TonB